MIENSSEAGRGLSSRFINLPRRERPLLAGKRNHRPLSVKVRSLSVKISTVKRFATLHFSSCSLPRRVNALRLVDIRQDLPCFLVIFSVLLGKTFKYYVQCFLVKCFSGVLNKNIAECESPRFCPTWWPSDFCSQTAQNNACTARGNQ